MAFCANCGARREASTAFCESCGARAHGQPARAAYTAATHPQAADRFTPPQHDTRTDAIHLASWFRWFLIGGIVLTIGEIAWGLIDDRFLPPALQAYAASQTLTALQGIVTILGLALLVVLLIAWIGLFVWRRWALHLYLSVVVALLLLGFAWRPTVQTAFASALGDVGTTITGILLGLGYFSDLRHRFRS